MAINMLLSVENLKKKGLIHRDTDTKILTTCIVRVQDMIIQEALGSPLFRALLDRVENDSWTANYTELMNDYVTPALVSNVDFKASIYLSKKMNNKGSGKTSDENQTALTDQELTPFQKELKRDGEFYLERLVGILRDDCGEKWSEYTESITDTNHDLKKKKDGYNTNWTV